MIKLGVFDLDGTLLDNEGKLPQSFYDDVNTLNQKGVHVAIASARPARFLFEIIDRNADILISGEDGNIFFKAGELLKVRYLNPSLINKVTERASKRDDMANSTYDILSDVLYTKGLNFVLPSPPL